ncbi:uncharacterized protein LOC135334925 isoform X3 [Halichondria panicea]|uniref:uncharacterized protein LOC135334925 isoform X3 n=1 Tax=Halichondria panicea TaxID=6063 RepID=UPI00312B892A
MEDWPAYESNCSSVESSLLAKDATTYIDIKCLAMVKSIQDRFNFRNVPPSNNYYYEDVGSDHEEPVTSTAIHSPNHLKRVCFGFTTTVLIVIGALVVFLLLLLAGDVEINPGPGLDTVLTVSDLFEVCERVKSASPNWFNLGLALKLSYTDLTNFHEMYDDNYVCLREVLAHRLQTGVPLTWGGICTALRHSTVARNDEAEEIEEYMYAQSREKEALKITQSTQKSDSSDDSVLTVSDLLEVCERVKSASPNWFSLGLALKLSYTDLTNFRETYRDNNDVCLREVLAHRLQSGVPLTWGGICTALRHSTVSRNDVGEAIEEHFHALPGVEVMASTCVIITNSPQTFHWVGYGLRLTIPQGSLPPGVDQCQLDIKVSVAGHYQFPNNFQLVSGVFWVRPHPSGRFQQQLTVEIQHCAKMSSSTKLSFMRAHCSQKSLPYTFKQLEERGSFTEYSLYGCLGVNHFSSLAIAAKDDADLQYIASLHYLKADPRTVEIYFTINMDDGTHNAETRKYFENLGAKEKLNMAVEFDDCNIALDIPLPNGVEVDEWSLVPLVLPKIFKKRVDSFEPGRAVPSTKLVATLSESWDCKVPRRSHLTTLKGAKEPINQMLIMFDPVDLKKDPLASDQHKRLSTSDEQIETLSKRLKNDITVQAVHGSQHGAPVAATASFLQGDQSGAQPEDPIASSHRKRALASDQEVETPLKCWKEDIALSSEGHPNKRPSSDPIVLTGKDVQIICVTLVKACNNWFNLGLALGMDYDQLESIQDQFRDSSGRLTKMIAKRLSVTDSKNPMTWPYICECLRSPTVMRYDVAEAIEREKGL